MADDHFSALVKRQQPFVCFDKRLYYVRGEGKDITLPGLGSFGLQKGPALVDVLRAYAARQQVSADCSELVPFVLFDLGSKLFSTAGDSTVDIEQVSDKNYLTQVYAKKLGATLDLETRSTDAMKQACTSVASESNDFIWWPGWDGSYELESAVPKAHFKGVELIKLFGKDYWQHGYYNPQALFTMVSEASRPDEYGIPPQLRDKKLEFENFGFEFKDGNVAVYLRVHPHVLKGCHADNVYHHRQRSDKDGCYYLMPYCELGVDIAQIGEVPQAHFVTGRGVFRGDNWSLRSAYLCMGTYSTGYFGRMQYSDAVVKLLLDAKKVETAGYTPHARIHFTAAEIGEPITMEEIKKKGLEITNAQVVD